MAAKSSFENLYSAIFASNQKVALKNELLENLKSDFFAQADILKQLQKIDTKHD